MLVIKSNCNERAVLCPIVHSEPLLLLLLLLPEAAAWMLALLYVQSHQSYAECSAGKMLATIALYFWPKTALTHSKKTKI